MTTTDNELKQLLAKMLPEKVRFFGKRLTWMYDFCGNFIEDGARAVLDTELLHLASLVEAGLTEAQKWRLPCIIVDYHTSPAGFPLFSRSEVIKLLSATWQQRTTALAEVLGKLTVDK